MKNEHTKILPKHAPAHPILEYKDFDVNDTEPCVRCENPMVPIRGSKKAICANCGYKNDCC